MCDLKDYRRQIEAALEYASGSHSFDDVVAAVAAGQMQAWYGPGSVMVTELIAYPGYKAVNIFVAGGELPELERMTGPVLEWAKSEGCTRAMFAGRPGWERTFLARTGWKVQKLVVMEKPLDG